MMEKPQFPHHHPRPGIPEPGGIERSTFKEVWKPKLPARGDIRDKAPVRTSGQTGVSYWGSSHLTDSRMAEKEGPVCLGCHNQVSQTFVSHSAGGWKTKVKVSAGRLPSWSSTRWTKNGSPPEHQNQLESRRIQPQVKVLQ